MSNLESIIFAIVNRKKISLIYKSDKAVISSYLILPHLVGELSTGNTVLSAYNVSDNASQAWKTFIIKNILSVQVLDEGFTQTAPNYNPCDSRMKKILCYMPK